MKFSLERRRLECPPRRGETLDVERPWLTPPWPADATLPSLPPDPSLEEEEELGAPRDLAARSAAPDLTRSCTARAPRRASSTAKSSAATASSGEHHRQRRPADTKTTAANSTSSEKPPARNPTLSYRMYRPETWIPHPPAAEAAGGGGGSHASAARTRWIGWASPKIACLL